MNTRHRTGAAVLLAATLGLTACSAGTDTRSSSSSASSPASGSTSPSTPPASTTTGPSASSTSPSATSSSPSSTPTSSPTKPAPTTPTTLPTPTPTTPKPPTSPTTPPPADDDATMEPGDEGPAVKRVQQQLSDLGYWMGTPDGEYGDLTTQAVLALQKTAGLGRDGVFGPATRSALERGVQPRLAISGNGVQINLATQVLTIVEGSRIVAILNTSTGSGQSYVSQGVTKVASTPKGTFSVFREVNGPDPSPLGMLYRSKYFNGGIAVHGYSSVPAYPVSHGCARVSNPAIDMIWARGLMPIGRTVVVF